EVFSNIPTTTVSSGGTTAPAAGTQETWTVASSSGFPAASSSALPPTQFHVADVALNSEMISVINVSGTTWTVIRGDEGTTPVSHGAGFTIYQVASAGAYTQLRSLDWLNVVTQFGADNTGTHDATAAIQAAISAGASVVGVTTVYLPAGVYKISSPLTLANGTIITGDSDGGFGGAFPPGISEITLASGSNCSMILAPSTANYWKLSNLQLNANGAGQAGPAQTGSAGAALHVEDGGAAAELQAELDCVFIEDSYND